MKFLTTPWQIKYAILSLVLFSYGCRTEERIDLSKVNLVEFVKWAGGVGIPDSSITISIQYYEKSGKYGEYPIVILWSIKNIADSIKYIEPPLGNPVSGNPMIMITAEDGGDVTPSNGVISEHWVIKKFIKLEAHDSVSYITKIVNKHNFIKGAKYRIVAIYYSGHALLMDNHKDCYSWYGKIKSNVLEYVY
jgi:hypothetical protein